MFEMWWWATNGCGRVVDEDGSRWYGMVDGDGSRWYGMVDRDIKSVKVAVGREHHNVFVHVVFSNKRLSTIRGAHLLTFFL